MKKLNIEVKRIDQYEILIDEKIWKKEELEDWSKVFSSVHNVDELAEHLAYKISRQGVESQFYEGFGYVQFYNKNGKLRLQHIYNKGEFERIKDYCAGIKVTVISHDDEYEFETSEVKP